MRVTAAAAFAALALVAAGCGSSSTSGIPAPPAAEGGARFLASAATRSTATPSMKTDLTVTMLSSQLPAGRIQMTATGALDNASHRMNMRIDMSKLVSQLGAAGALGSGNDWVGEEVGDFGDGRAIIYMRLPALTRVMPGGKPWIKMDLNALGKQAGIDLSQFTQLGTDPSRMVDWLRTVSGDVTTVGTEKLDGIDTTHYRATVDLSKYPDLVPPDQREAVQRAVDQLTKAAHLSSFPVHVWVDEDGLVRQVRAVLTETIQGQTVNVVTTERFYDFGAPVDIQLPAESQVTDISTLAGSAGK
jgi:hypothetical protein